MGSDPSIHTICEGFSRGIRVVPESSIQTIPPQLSPFRNSESVKISGSRLRPGRRCETTGVSTVQEWMKARGLPSLDEAIKKVDVDPAYSYLTFSSCLTRFKIAASISYNPFTIFSMPGPSTGLISSFAFSASARS